MRSGTLDDYGMNTDRYGLLQCTSVTILYYVTAICEPCTAHSFAVLNE